MNVKIWSFSLFQKSNKHTSGQWWSAIIKNWSLKAMRSFCPQIWTIYRQLNVVRFTQRSAHCLVSTRGSWPMVSRIFSSDYYFVRIDGFYIFCSFHMYWIPSFIIVLLWRACNLTSLSPCLTGPVDYPFASRHEGPVFKSPGGYLCETGISPVSIVSLHWWPRRDPNTGFVILKMLH